MSDVFTKAKRSQVMSRIKGTGYKDTEMRLISIFKTHGITGWRRRWPLEGKPDLVFPKLKLAVFFDGCCSGLASPTGLVVASLLETGTAARCTPPSRNRTWSFGKPRSAATKPASVSSPAKFAPKAGASAVFGNTN